MDFRFQIGFQILDFKSDCRFQVSDFGFQILDFEDIEDIEDPKILNNLIIPWSERFECII